MCERVEQGGGAICECKPNGVVAFSVLDPGCIPIFRDVGVDVFHQKIGGKDSTDEVSSDMAVVKVVLEQRRDLSSIRTAGGVRILVHLPRQNRYQSNSQSNRSVFHIPDAR